MLPKDIGHALNAFMLPSFYLLYSETMLLFTTLIEYSFQYSKSQDQVRNHYKPYPGILIQVTKFIVLPSF